MAEGNTFLHPIDELRFGTYEPGDVEPALDETEKLVWQRIDELLAIDSNNRDFDNTVLALTRSSEEFDSVCSLVMHLEMVLGEDWNQASSLASDRYTKLHSQIGFNKEIYQALLDYKENSNIDKLSDPKQKLLKEIVLEYERNGIDLPTKQKDQLQEINTRLSQLSIEFSQNIVKSMDASGLLLSEQKKLSGLDSEFIDECRSEAENMDESGYWVQMNEPNYIKVMSECEVRQTRQAMYEKMITLCEEDNKELALEILDLRQQLASILGFDNYADYALQMRMAKNGQAAKDFIERLRDCYDEKSRQEVAALSDFVKRLEEDPELELDASDVITGIDFYYAAKMREQTSGISGQELKQYFTLTQVLDTMFATLTQMYRVKFQESDRPVWHKDVEVYEVHDKDGSHLATVWCDWYDRKGKKSGAWMNEYFVAKRGGGNKDKPHLGYVCANLSNPGNDKPSLLNLRDIETIWHEFGHFMHLALSEPELKEQSMMNCKWDFVEAPSQIMENWVWEPEILAAMSKHYQSGEALGEKQIDQIIADRNFMIANKAMRQFSLANIDLDLHMKFDPNQQDLLDYARQVKQQHANVEVYPNDATILTFAHIFAGGYAAGYYSYKWAEAIEADLFSRFADEGVTNGQTGHDYRWKVLARGDETRPDELIRDFLGRDFSIDAMLVRDGVDNKS